MMTDFTPLAALAGGALIGFSAVGLLLFSGRIAGITGLLRRVLPGQDNARPFEAGAFIAGMLAAPLAYRARNRKRCGAKRQWQRGADGCRGVALRFRFGGREWVHERPWGVRAVASVAALDRRHGRLHGGGHGNGVCHAAWAGRGLR